jgi:predicted RNA-binding protein YlxR (DUF448 family)
MLAAANAVKRDSDKKIKDPNKPKRGKSAYICFCTKNREAAKKELGDGAKATEVTSHLGEMWRALKESKKASDKKTLVALELEAAEDKARYNEEIKDYIPPSDDELLASKKGSKKKSDKDPNAPKRNKTAYIYFCSDKRAEAKSELGDDAKATEVTALLGKMWKELKEDDDRSDELEKYTKMAADDKARYENETKKVDEEDKPAKPVGKKVVDDTKPAKSKTGYTYFCQSNRESVKDDNPEMKATEVTKELARLWKELSDEDRQDWSDSAKQI